MIQRQGWWIRLFSVVIILGLVFSGAEISQAAIAAQLEEGRSRKTPPAVASSFTDIVIQNLEYAGKDLDSFDPDVFLKDAKSPLAQAQFTVPQGVVTSGEMVLQIARETSVNPRAILTLMETEFSAVSLGVAPIAAASFYQQVKRLSQKLAEATIASHYGDASESATWGASNKYSELSSGKGALIQWQNAIATPGLSEPQFLFDKTQDFIGAYAGYFGDPTVLPISVNNAQMPSDAVFPYEGDKIQYSGGPHFFGTPCSTGGTTGHFVSDASGIDFANGDFRVLAISDGLYLGRGDTGKPDDDSPTAGKWVKIKHGDLTVGYWHLDSFSEALQHYPMSVTTPIAIPRGFPIGIAGKTWNQTGVHLHLELKAGSQAESVSLGPYSGISIPWDGKAINGWTVGMHRLTTDISRGYNYQGSLVRGMTTVDKSITLDICEKPQALARVSSGFTNSVEANFQNKQRVDADTVFAWVGSGGVTLPSTNVYQGHFPLPNAPQLATPTNGSEVLEGTSISLSWNVKSGERYLVKVSARGQMDLPIDSFGPTTASSWEWRAKSPGLYYWRVTAISPGGQSHSEVRVIKVSAAISPSPWTAEYFAGNDASFPTENLLETRYESSVGYHQQGGWPGGSISSTDFSVRWSRREKFGTLMGWWYVFKTVTDDGVRVYLDNQLIIDDWNYHSVKTNTVSKWVLAGEHDVRVEYFQSADDAQAWFAYAAWPATPVFASDGFVPPAPPPPTTDPQPGDSQIRTDSDLFIADLSLPDGTTVSPSQALVKTWRLKNTGTATWSAGYQLAFVSGEQMGAPNAVNVPTTAPNAMADISINLTAPTASGDHTGFWQMRNPQGTYFGPQIWVKVKTVTASGGGGSSHITSFDVNPASPSAATSVHLVARINAFPEFRAMRFVAGNNIFEMTNFRQVGSQYEISADWNTASLARGNYALTLEVATQGDTSWANPERQIKTYTLNGTPASTNRAPDRPVLLSPYNWYLKDAAGASTQVQLCVSAVNDPDGDAVQYYFEWSGASPGNSGWVSSNCVSPTFSPNGYAWHAKARDSQGAESGWSVDTWNFNVAFGNVSIGTPTFYQVSDPDNTHMCVLVTYGGIIAPEVKAWINLANDGTENGEWRQLDHYGPSAPPDCTSSNVHGFWIRSANYTTGNHVIRISAEKNDSGASANKTLVHNIPYMRPPAPRALAPSSYENNGTWWNTRTIHFEWTVPLRTESQTLRVSTSSNVWSDPAPLLEVALSNTASQYTYTFGQDYGQLYWSVRATNSAGSADFGALRFGIDLVAPTCAVSSPGLAYDNNFQVNWSGADNSAGVRSYEIWASDQEGVTGGIWRTALAAQTYDLFNGQPGHHYSFYCRVTDNAGNLSDWQSYAATQVDPNARPPAPWWNAAYANKRTVTVLNNMPGVTLPNGYPVKLRFDGTTNPSAAEIYNASLSSPKCNDLRLVYNDATELNRVATKCSASEVELWFRTQADVGGGTNGAAYQVYYGNASAGAPPNSRNQVFYPVTDANYLRVFDMHEGSGQTVYDAVSNVNATLGSELTWVNGKFGPAVRIPGDLTPEPRPAIYADYGNQPACAFTVELWLKRLNGHSYGGVLAEQEIGGPNPWRWIFMIQDNKLRLNVEGRGDAMSNAALSDATFFDNWHHLAVTYACNGETRFYIDGQLDVVRQIGGGGLNSATAPLRIGNNAYSSQRLAGDIQGFALSNVAQASFPYAAFAAITNEPLAQAGAPQTPPTTGSRTLDVLGVNTYPNPSGGLLVEAIVRNSGTLPTGNGFSTDIYLNHIPTGQNDRTGSVSFWVNDPIAAGATVTLTTNMANVTQLNALWLATKPMLTPLGVEPVGQTLTAPLTSNAEGEVTGMLYAQADSTGAVMNGATATSIYAAGTPICLTSPDVYDSSSQNLLSNPGAEINDTSLNWSPEAWEWSSGTLAYLSDEPRSGNYSFRIDAPIANDVRWIQPVTLEPDTTYRLSGWIRTQDVAHSEEGVDAGANLSVWGETWNEHSTGIFGTQDWTFVSIEFNSGTTTQATIGLRLGYWYGTTTGTVWFDDIRLERLPFADSQPQDARPLALDETQRHNFHQQGDSDWVVFMAEEGKTYWITTSNLGAAADTYLYLYDTDTVTLLASNDDYANSLASRIEWTAPASALYYGRVIGWNPNVQGCGTGYDLMLGYALNNMVYLPLIQR